MNNLPTFCNFTPSLLVSLNLFISSLQSSPWVITTSLVTSPVAAPQFGLLSASLSSPWLLLLVMMFTNSLYTFVVYFLDIDLRLRQRTVVAGSRCCELHGTEFAILTQCPPRLQNWSEKCCDFHLICLFSDKQTFPFRQWKSRIFIRFKIKLQRRIAVHSRGCFRMLECDLRLRFADNFSSQHVSIQSLTSLFGLWLWISSLRNR